MPTRNPLRLGQGALNFWPFLPVASRAPIYGRLLWELAKDDRVPMSRKAVLGVAAAYVISPIDLIPDFVPFISRLDDMAVVVLAVDLFLESVPRDLMMEKMQALGIDGRELERDLESMRRVVPKPLRHAARRLPRTIDRTTRFVRRQLEERGLTPSHPARGPVPEEEPPA